MSFVDHKEKPHQSSRHLKLSCGTPFHIVRIVKFILRAVAALDLCASELDCLVVMCEPVREKNGWVKNQRTASVWRYSMNPINPQTAQEDLHDELWGFLLLISGLFLSRASL